MIFRLAPWQYACVYSPVNHLAFYGGVATGKTFSGAHFAIRMMREHPDLTGFIGANSYDQLSQATLRELFYWLDQYKIPFVIDRQPPKSWGERGTKLKDYHNVLSVRIVKGSIPYTVTIFTRVLSDPNPLRGIEFSWYWIDKTRDTPETTHDVILSRLREDAFVMGRITSTTNGEDWGHARFVVKADGTLYNSMHIATIESVKCGVITQAYYDTMLRSYSPMMVLQELEAKHVNIFGGRAYYAASDRNKSRVAPWGDSIPNTDRPLLVGMDFNFSPAPCVWVVAQMGPNLWGPKGEFWGDHVHVFAEIAEVEVSTHQMTEMLLNRFPGFFYQCFGDASGNRGTTSNAGQTDYDQVGIVFAEANAMYSIDADQANPRVKDRVENLNSALLNGLQEVHLTYDPQGCPLLDGDMRCVGWKETIQMGRGKLDDGGNKQMTHATDGLGYLVWKVKPPGRKGMLTENVPNPYLSSLSSVLGAHQEDG